MSTQAETQHARTPRVTADRLRLLAGSNRARLSEARLRTEMIVEIGKLSDGLTVHFAQEPITGYLSELIGERPELCSAIHALEGERTSLNDDFTRLGERPEYETLATILPGLQKLLDRFERHEDREDHLFLSWSNTDIGVGD